MTFFNMLLSIIIFFLQKCEFFFEIDVFCPIELKKQMKKYVLWRMLYFPTLCFWKKVNKFNDSRNLVGCSRLLYIILQFSNKTVARLTFTIQYYSGLNHLSPLFVPYPRNRTFHHIRMREQYVLHLCRSDSETAEFDYLVFSAYIPIISVTI